MDWYDFTEFPSDSIPFGVDANGVPHAIDTVERGLKCACFCSECDSPLQARKGEIRRHYFAHDSLAGCRHALEASFYAMATWILTQPGTALRMPGWESRREWCKNAGLDPQNSETSRYMRETDWIIQPTQIRIAPGRWIAPVKSLRDSSWSNPDLVGEGQPIDIHLLSHRKKWKDRSVVRCSDRVVVALNLSTYIKEWWTVCDAEKQEMIDAARDDREGLASWMANEVSGRGYLEHPEINERRAEFEMWARTRRTEDEERRRESEAKARDEYQARVECLNRREKERDGARRQVARTQERRDSVNTEIRKQPAVTAEDLEWILPSNTGGQRLYYTAFDSVRTHMKQRTREAWGLREIQPGIWGWIGAPGQMVPWEVRKLLDRSKGVQTLQ